jgi:hypothetical protein
MDEKSFKQEYEASWESFDGLAYYNFDENLHIKPCSQLDENLPVDICLDFNVNPTTLLVAQEHGGRIQVRREYCLPNSSTIKTIQNFCYDHKHIKGRLKIRVFGDAAGNSRTSKTGFSDYHYIKECLTNEGFDFEMCVKAANPGIVDRVTYLNSWLKNYHGESRIDIDPSCVYTIRDLSSQTLEGRFPSDKNNLGHRADGLGYRVEWAQTIGERKKQATVIL